MLTSITITERAEWERKFEELKRRKLKDQDELIKGLIAAKERAEAESKVCAESMQTYTLFR